MDWASNHRNGTNGRVKEPKEVLYYVDGETQPIKARGSSLILVCKDDAQAARIEHHLRGNPPSAENMLIGQTPCLIVHNSNKHSLNQAFDLTEVSDPQQGMFLYEDATPSANNNAINGIANRVTKKKRDIEKIT